MGNIDIFGNEPHEPHQYIGIIIITALVITFIICFPNREQVNPSQCINFFFWTVIILLQVLILHELLKTTM